MMDEGMELIEQKIRQAIAVIERLRAENENLKKEVARISEEMQKLKESTSVMNVERKVIKDKINSAVTMLDRVNLDDVLDSIADEVKEETSKGN